MVEPPPSPAPVTGARRYLTFLARDRRYALPAEAVAEVIRTPAVARMPLAPPALIGIANLRGAVLPVVSLRGLLGLEEMSEKGSRAIVLSGTSPAALAVDSVESLVAISEGRVAAAGAELAAEPGERIAGAFEVEGRGIVKILDVQTLLADAFARQEERKRPNPTRVAKPVRTSEAEGGARALKLVTFEVADQEYALPLAEVEEILPAPTTAAAIPRAEPLVIGVVTHRERLLPLLSLRGLLGFAPRAPDGREKVVITTVRGVVVGLVVDRAREIVAAAPESIEPVPAVLAARSGGEARLKAVYRGDQGRRIIAILSPDQLFREDVMKRLDSLAASSAPRPAPARAKERQFLVFQLGGDEFGLPVEAVGEVARVPDRITRVPKTPAFLEGVINLRGEVLPVVDQRRRFNMARYEGAKERRLIVVRTDRYRAGLIVDGVSEVRRCAEHAIEPAPDLTGDLTRLVQGVINLAPQGRIVLLLDPLELLTRAEHGLLDALDLAPGAGS